MIVLLSMFSLSKKYLIFSLIALTLASGISYSLTDLLSSDNYECIEESESPIETNGFVTKRIRFTPKKIVESNTSNLFLSSFQSSTSYPQKISVKKDRHILFRSLLI
jgi:hypothetical protein